MPQVRRLERQGVMTPITLEDLEQELRAALAADNATRIAQVGAELDALEAAQQRPAVTCLAAALWYAEHGTPVFPLSPGTKIPLKGSKGLKDATTDEAQIRDWWEATPEANLAIATGHTIDVIDIDGLPGHVSRARHWDDLDGDPTLGELARVLTPRPGGLHIYIRARGHGNRAAMYPGVDYRGRGGYVVAPPSVLAGHGDDHAGPYLFTGAVRLGQLQEAAA
jgi:hypothetical protein